jgi:glycosyltransferase involved in cell wall biosynthesis
VQIVVNTRLLLKDKLDGIGWFTYQTLKRITTANPDVHFVFLFDREYDEEFIFADNVTPLIVGPQARHPFLYHVWFQSSIRSLLRRMQPDLFLSPDGFAVLGAKCKQLVVLHDINFFHHPKDLKWLTGKYYNFYFPKFARKATRIATVSEFSKKDIAQNYRVKAENIDVVYNGINSFFRKLSEDEKVNARKKFSNSKPYFLFVGNLIPRKNIPNLIKAFSLFKKESKSEQKLVLAGRNYWGMSGLYELIKESGSENEVILTNRLSDEELTLVMGAADALTFVPYYEGFGIPLVEAMQAEIPIICSKVTSLPEVAGEAALYVDPKDVEDIKNAMLRIHKDAELRNSLVEKGKKQREKFSWDKSADLLWKSIQRTLEN